ncbi:putative transposase [Escherichia coli P0305260.3]|nr:putative transposase [Escherichia coli P0305260.3]
MYSQSLGQWNKLLPIVSHIRPDFPEQYEPPVDGLGEKRAFLVILFTSFSGRLVSRIPGAVQFL